VSAGLAAGTLIFYCCHHVRCHHVFREVLLMHRISFVLAGLLLAIPAARAADFVAPGVWEQTTSRSTDGKTWRPGVRTQGCLTQQQADDWVPQVRQQIAAAGCEATTLTIAGGKVSGVLSCPGQAASAVRIGGSYTASAYDIDVGVSGAVPSGPVGLFARWKGRRLGDC
jgi:hypothetical protein